jgi:hypothetical protein
MVPYFFAKDTAKINGLVTINSSGAQLAPVTATHGLVTVTASVENSHLIVTGFINRDSIVTVIRDSIRLENAIRESASKTTVTVRQKYVPGFYKFTFWFAVIEWGLLLLWGLIKLGVVKFIKL